MSQHEGTTEEQRIMALLDELVSSGKSPEGLMEALKGISGEGLLDRVLAKLESLGALDLGDRPPDTIASYYRPGPGSYRATWPITVPLPVPFDRLDRPTQFSVLFCECTRRLAEGSALRNMGRLDEGAAAFEECLERARQIDVPILESDAYQGLMTIADKRGNAQRASELLALAERSRAAQAQR